MKFFRSLLLSAMPAMTALVIAAQAQAAPVIITDQMDSSATYQGNDYGSYSSANFSNRTADGKHWGDELSNAGHPFDTTQITVNRDDAAKTMTFTLHTMFNGNDQGAHYADLFLDTATPNTLDNFNYAIALGGQTQGPGLYTVGSASTSNDIWGGQSTYVYGGYTQFNTSSPNFDPNMALPVTTRLDSGTLQSGYTVAVSQTDAGGGFFDVNVTLTSLTDLSLLNAFDVFWGTGDCGNDVIWGSVNTQSGNTQSSGVPTPGALSLLMAGLIGLAMLRGTPMSRRITLR